MREKLFTQIAASAVAFTVVCLPLATDSSATSCDDIEIIFARGSGQKLEDEDYLVYKTSITAELLRQKSNLKVGFHELDYPAVDLDFFTLLGSKVSGGAAFAFGDSVKQGIAELKKHTKSVSAACPSTKFILGGYSQGAMVVGNALSSLDPSKFIYVSTFGDPKLFLPEGAGAIPLACLGQNFSSYRVYAPDCKTYIGSLNPRVPYLAAGWEEKVGLWCKENDIICGASLKFGEPREYHNLLEKIIQSALFSHTRYSLDGIYISAAKTIVEKVKEIYPDKFHDDPTVISNNRDTVILIDTTGSMYGFMDYYRTEALHVAEETINAGGRVALYTYGDIATRKAERIVDFTTDIKLFTTYLNSTGSMLDGNSSRKTSYLSAILTILNSQNWRAGATKSIITLSNSSILDPDRDGTTREQVHIRSLEIDPVNLYLATINSDIVSSYEDTINSTSGVIFDKLDAESATYTINRPSVEFPLSSYSGKPGDQFVFTATTTGEIEKYEWDLDFDGIFETISDSPSATKQYNFDTSGYLQLKVTDKTGRISTASTKVDISSEPQASPTLNNLKVIQKEASVHIAYELGENTIGTLIALDDAVLGLTDQTSLEITNITKDTTLTITPISNNGTLGTPIVGEVTFTPRSNTGILVPKTGRK